MNTTIVFVDGFKKSEGEAVLAACQAAGQNSQHITLVPVTDKLEAMVTEQALEIIVKGEWPGGTVKTEGPRGVLIQAPGKIEALGIMRAFKKVLPKDHDTAFAIISEKGRTWTIGFYLGHIRKEHEFMKNASPEDDPDMRPV